MKRMTNSKKIQIKGNFTKKIPLNALQEHRYDVKFPKEAQYILLIVDDEEEKDVKLKVYDKDEDNGLPIEEGFNLWNNIYVLDLRKFTDESKIYDLVVEAGSFGTDPFVHYQFSQMIGNQLQEPIISNFTIRDSDHSVLREGSKVIVKWFIFKSNQIGDGKLKIKWTTKNTETENSGDIKTNIHFGIYKYDE